VRSGTPGEPEGATRRSRGAHGSRRPPQPLKAPTRTSSRHGVVEQPQTGARDFGTARAGETARRAEQGTVATALQQVRPRAGRVRAKELEAQLAAARAAEARGAPQWRRRAPPSPARDSFAGASGEAQADRRRAAGQGEARREVNDELAGGGRDPRAARHASGTSSNDGARAGQRLGDQPPARPGSTWCDALQPVMTSSEDDSRRSDVQAEELTKSSGEERRSRSRRTPASLKAGSTRSSGAGQGLRCRATSPRWCRRGAAGRFSSTSRGTRISFFAPGAVGHAAIYTHTAVVAHPAQGHHAGRLV